MPSLTGSDPHGVLAISRPRVRSGWFLAALLVAIAVALIGAYRPALATADTGSTIVTIAEGQDQNHGAIKDNPISSACNPYSNYWGDGSAAGCAAGNRDVEWCADFAAWAWRQAGVSFTYGSGGSDINAWSASFYFWGVAHGTWHPLSSGYAPQPGDVAVYGNLTDAPGPGHVGIYVSGPASSPRVVNGNWALNYPTDSEWGVYTQSGESNTGVSGGTLDGYVSPGAGSPLTDGSFVSYNGNVYRMAGGAPLYVSSWANVGGPQPTTALTAAQWAALSPVPANGTLITSSATGMVYEIAGGAPIYVSSWAAIGGARPATVVDQWDLDNITNPLAHLNAVPSDGTLVSSSATGMVYEIAGGAPLYVSTWTNIGGPRPATAIDQWALDNITNPAAHMNAYPADGTLLASSTGAVYVVAGGAPLYLSSWAAIGGMKPYVNVDQWDIDNISNPAAHLRPVPVDGTLITSSATGMVYEIAGGAPLYVSTWANIGGARPATVVDQWDLDNIANPAAHMNAYPDDGTFINTLPGGRVYRIAGGTPFYVTSWSIYGGPQPTTTVDAWDVDNMANPAAHLRATPLDGTVVEGLPSDSFWSFSDGSRSSVAAQAAVGVDDASLAAFPLTVTHTPPPVPNPDPDPKRVPVCVIQSLAHKTLAQAKTALTRAHCALGSVSRPRKVLRHWVLRVSSQSPRAGQRHPAGYRVRIALRASRS